MLLLAQPHFFQNLPGARQHAVYLCVRVALTLCASLFATPELHARTIGGAKVSAELCQKVRQTRSYGQMTPCKEGSGKLVGASGFRPKMYEQWTALTDAFHLILTHELEQTAIICKYTMLFQLIGRVGQNGI